MRLLHYSDTPLMSVYDQPQSGPAYEWHCGRKPVGLWVSVEGEDDWASWCKAESFRDVDQQDVAEIVLKPLHDVLVLTNPAHMTDFHIEFAEHGAYDMEYIDWPAVAKLYQGIIIAPYQWHHRLDGACSNWYYSWDCASGCIWDARAVQEIRHIVAEPA